MVTLRQATQQVISLLEAEFMRRPEQKIHAAITALRQALADEPQAEPVAWMFQHDETGRTMFVDTQQVEWGFEINNPRWKKIGPVYSHPQPAQWIDLTDEEMDGALRRAGVVATFAALRCIGREVEVKLRNKNGGAS